MKDALIEQEWEETLDPDNDCLLDLKFTYTNWWTINYERYSPQCWINHARGESSITTKEKLSRNLESCHHFTSNLYPMHHADPDGHGIQAFFPRCFSLTTSEGCGTFLTDYYNTEAECVVKRFIENASEPGSKLEKIFKR
jgi:hypothetical protein